MFQPIVERLLCMMALDDNLAAELEMPPNAWWRGFVVKNRETGLISARYRMKYDNRPPNWYELQANADNPHTMEKLVEGLEGAITTMVTMAAKAMGKNIEGRQIIECWYPPDDKGDVQATLDWLIQQDLIEIKAVGTAEKLMKEGRMERADMLGFFGRKVPTP